jgi:taurine dioxygenase
MPFSVKPVEPFGCEVDLDIAARTDADEAVLRDLLARQHLIVFRNQTLSHDEQANFMAAFGPVLPGEEGMGVIINDPSPDNTLGDGPLGFHSDLSFCPKPYGIMSLLAVEVEDGRSSTQFTDTARIAAALPQDLREKARGAQAKQVISYDLGGPNRNHPDPDAMSHVHPAIRAHPQTGEDVIMVSLNQTAAIVNMDHAEGDALIDALCERLYDPSQIYEHVWHRGDLVLFDNQALQHARGPVSDVGTRRLQRVVVAEAGLFEQFPGRTITTEAGSSKGFGGKRA